MEELFTEQTIDRNSAIPLYYQLYTYMEKLIKEGELKEGDKLPPEEELVSTLGISRPTIRQAYKALADKGYVQRQRSRGTIVTKPKVFSKFLTELTTFRSEFRSDGQAATKVLVFEVCSDEEAAAVLHTKKQIHLVRLRYNDQIPVVYLETYLPYGSCKEVLLYDMEKESLYETLEKLGHGVKRVERHLKAAKPDAKAAEYLEMEPDEPIMFSRTTGYDAQEDPVEYSIASYHGAYTDFEIQLTL